MFRPRSLEADLQADPSGQKQRISALQPGDQTCIFCGEVQKLLNRDAVGRLRAHQNLRRAVSDQGHAVLSVFNCKDVPQLLGGDDIGAVVRSDGLRDLHRVFRTHRILQKSPCFIHHQRTVLEPIFPHLCPGEIQGDVKTDLQELSLHLFQAEHNEFVLKVNIGFAIEASA